VAINFDALPRLHRVFAASAVAYLLLRAGHTNDNYGAIPAGPVR